MNAFGETVPSIIPLDSSENQFEIYAKISPNYTHSFLFESLTGPEELAETSIIGFDPAAIIRGYSDRAEITHRDGSSHTIKTKNPLEEIKKLLYKSKDLSYRYLGGAVGIVNYDAAQIYEDVPRRHGIPEPLIEFGIYEDGILYDNVKKRPFYFYNTENRLADLKINGRPGSAKASEIKAKTGRKEFEEMVEQAKRYIIKGDIFQAVLSRRFSFEINGDSIPIYEKLRTLNPSPYMYHLKQGGRTIIGASPEMLVRTTEKRAETFPIAGTRRITGDPLKDQSLAKELRCDEKELAEHTMLVDLGRNDIGRVCTHGSVKVEDLMRIKRFSHVQHMVSHVTGTLAEQYDMFDAFASVFPAGTVSGAPKVRAMQIIDELEPHSRGPYAGAVGYFSYNGCCDFAIAIRSIFINGNEGFVQSGAGIVYDSAAGAEFEETQHKADAMIQAIREAAS